MPTVLIVDDEPLACVHLKRLLESQGATVLGEANDAGEALQLAEDLQPDLLFLDIQMPGLTGLQMATALGSLDAPPLVVFVTGYTQHAIEAFEHNALDYLVKPVSPNRLAKTLARALARLSERAARRQPPSATAPGENVRSGVGPTAPQEMSPALTRLPIREDYSVRFIPVQEIMCALARDKRVYIRTAEGEHRTYYTLAQLETLLPGDRFLRIHDSCLVNLDYVQELHLLGNHSYMIRLSNGLQLPVSRSRYAQLQQRLRLNVLPSS